MGIIFSAFASDLCAGADPRRDVFRPLWQQSDLCPVNFLLVAVYPAAKFHPRPKIPAASAPRDSASAKRPAFRPTAASSAPWFPQHERARATATYTVGEYIGLAAFSPLLFLILEHHGWRTLFFLTGGLGILFTLVWWRFYHEPHESRTANQAELEYIGASSINNKIQNVPFNWRDARRLLGCRQILGASLGSVRRQHHTGLFPDVVSQLPRQRAPSSMAARRLLRHWPFLAAAIGILFGGWISDRLLKRTGSVNISRKLPIISGLLLSSCIIAANWVSANSTVIIIMSVAFFWPGGWSVWAGP